MFNKFMVNIKVEEHSLKMKTVGNYIYMYIIGNTTYTCKKLFFLEFFKTGSSIALLSKKHLFFKNCLVQSFNPTKIIILGLYFLFCFHIHVYGQCDLPWCFCHQSWHCSSAPERAVRPRGSRTQWRQSPCVYWWPGPMKGLHSLLDRRE